MPGTYYQSSGRSPVVGVLLSMGLSAIAAIVLAFAYAYLINYIPIAGYITFLFSIGFGIGMGFIAAFTLRLGKVRGKGASWLVFLVTALIGFVVSWVVWTYVTLNRAEIDVGLMDLFKNLGGTWAVIKGFNEAGAWSLRGWTPTGGILWVLWFVEAALIFGATLVMGLGHIGDEAAFCERCNVWCKSIEGAAVVGHDNNLPAGAEPAETLKQRAEQSDWAYFSGLPQPDINGLFYRIDLHVCEQCKQTNTLTVQEVSVSVDKEGDRSENATAVVDKLLITPQDVEKLSQLRVGEVEVPVTG